MNNPIEGVDYIVDHYAVLGLGPQADADAVHKAIREMRAQPPRSPRPDQR